MINYDWQKAVQCIPKDESVIPEEVCEKLRTAFKDKTNLNVLDIGGGEGRLSFNIFKKLKIDKTNIASWVVIEGGNSENQSKHEGMLDEYEKRFKEFFTITRVCQEIKDTTESFDAILNAKELPTQFDLILISHTTYYFPDGGLKLANEVVLKRLNPAGGFAWFVVRDKNCTFYEERSNYFARHKIRDYYSHKFSSYFISYCWTMFSNVFCQEETHDLLPDRDTDFICWKEALKLMWALEELESQHLDNEYIASIPTELSEHHILVPTQSNSSLVHSGSTEQEQIANAATTTADCSQEISNLIPSVNFIRCSVSTIQPKWDNTKSHSDAKKYKLYLTASGFVNKNGINLLNKFLEKNMSFLDTQAFFYDNPIISIEASENGRTLLQNRRHLLSKIGMMPDFGMNSRTPEIKQNPEKIEADRLSDHDIGLEWKEWITLLQENLELSHETEKDFSVWTMAVGLYLTKTWEPTPTIEDGGLAGRISFFTTVQIPSTDFSDEDAEQLFELALDKIKVRLVQDLSTRAFKEVKRQRDIIEMQRVESQLYRDRFDSLQGPLTEITNTMRVVESKVNDMDRLLNEPNTGLFRHHMIISSLFDEDKDERIGKNKIKKQHDPKKYSPDEGKLLFGHAIIILLGEHYDDKESKLNSDELLNAIKEKISKIEKDKDNHTHNWLRCLSHLLFNIDKMSDVLWDGIRYKHALTILKQVFHTTFKPVTKKWPLRSLIVALWPNSTNKKRPKITFLLNQKEHLNLEPIAIKPEHTPISYPIFLTFVVALLQESNSRKDPLDVSECIVSHIKRNNQKLFLQVKLKLSGSYLNSEMTLFNFRELIRIFAKNKPSDQSISGINFNFDAAGDLIKPWRDLMRLIHTFGLGWGQYEIYPDDAVRYYNFRSKRQFSVEIKTNCIIFCWDNI